MSTKASLSPSGHSAVDPMRTTATLHPFSLPTGWQSLQLGHPGLSHLGSLNVTVTPSRSPFFGSIAGVGTFSTSAATTFPSSRAGQSCSCFLRAVILYLEPGSRLLHTLLSLQPSHSSSGPM